MYSSDDYRRFMTTPPPEPTPPSFNGAMEATSVPVRSPDPLFGRDKLSEAPLGPKVKDPRVPWSSGLCDCCSDPRNCCITCWCPCITFGQIAEIVDKGSSACCVNGTLYTLIACVTLFPYCYSCFYRAKMRQQYHLKPSPCCDCLVHCCCECCALCQEYRELKTRGFDMAIGWHGNMERQHRGFEMSSMSVSSQTAPKVEDGMTR